MLNTVLIIKKVSDQPDQLIGWNEGEEGPMYMTCEEGLPEVEITSRMGKAMLTLLSAGYAITGLEHDE